MDFNLQTEGNIFPITRFHRSTLSGIQNTISSKVMIGGLEFGTYAKTGSGSKMFVYTFDSMERVYVIQGLGTLLKGVKSQRFGDSSMNSLIP